MLALITIACNKDETNPIGPAEITEVEASGRLQAQGITTYQYGTHVIPGYALRSSTVNLDDFIGQNVTVVGHLVDGYPVEDGPDYLEVERVK